MRDKHVHKGLRVVVTKGSHKGRAGEVKYVRYICGGSRWRVWLDATDRQPQEAVVMMSKEFQLEGKS